jgi:pimeloyl-ACP methyl ester carboxylesterase
MSPEQQIRRCLFAAAGNRGARDLFRTPPPANCCGDRDWRFTASQLAGIVSAGGRSKKAPPSGRNAVKRIAHLVAAGLLLSLPAAAHTPQQPPHQLYGEGDLKLESGEAIKDFSISYVTHGTLNAKKSNAILMVTAISGNHHRLDFMIGPGKALDPQKYFIVCTDAIANGLSTSPSNSRAQPRMQFPKFTIRDMVESQYRLMKEKLGIDHVVAVIGPSMGGMQALQWGVSHPDYMDALVAMVPLAKTPAWSVAVVEASRKAIMNDPAWKDGNYEAPPAVARHSQFAGGAHAGHVCGAVQGRHGGAALDGGAGDRGDEGVRRQRLDLPDLGL